MLHTWTRFRYTPAEWELRTEANVTKILPDGDRTTDIWVDYYYSTTTGLMDATVRGQAPWDYLTGYYIPSFDEEYGGINVIKCESSEWGGADRTVIVHGTRYYTVKVKDEWTSEEGETITSTEQNAYTNGINGGFKYIYQGLK